ncbi:hypothetical protein ACFZDJ_39770 [Streptomyces sp. NPDC007896]|uniref:hypothetical protein n=1 Tax=Streptomyces sp. NPDC007896 TaxID=3364784 RepID=UPI0036E6F9B6
MDMRVSHPRRTLLPAAIAGLAALSLTTQPASAAAFPASHPRVLVEYDLASGEQPENVVVTPNGKLNIVLSRSAQLEEVTPGGHRRLLASLPQPADGGVNTPALDYSLATGLVRTDDGTLYVGYAADDGSLTGIWRIRPGGKPQRIIALSAASFPNGMALDERTGRLYIADSTRGVIWGAPITGETPTVWASGTAYEPTSLLSVNGVKLHNGAVWVSNSDQAALLRVPVKPDGSAAAAHRRRQQRPRPRHRHDQRRRTRPRAAAQPGQGALGAGGIGRGGPFPRRAHLGRPHRGGSRRLGHRRSRLHRRGNRPARTRVARQEQTRSSQWGPQVVSLGAPLVVSAVCSAFISPTTSAPAGPSRPSASAGTAA